jgi:hypothetical protein
MTSCSDLSGPTVGKTPSCKTTTYNTEASFVFSILVKKGLQQLFFSPFTAQLENILRTKPTGIFTTIKEVKPAFNLTGW